MSDYLVCEMRMGCCCRPAAATNIAATDWPAEAFCRPLSLEYTNKASSLTTSASAFCLGNCLLLTETKFDLQAASNA